MWFNSGYILKTEATVTDGLNRVWSMRERGIKNDSRAFERWFDLSLTERGKLHFRGNNRILVLDILILRC